MKVTVHAAQRFLERVMNKHDYSFNDVKFSIKYLEKVFQDVIPRNNTKHFVLPGFERYRAVCVDNAIVTIISKDK